MPKTIDMQAVEQLRLHARTSTLVCSELAYGTQVDAAVLLIGSGIMGHLVIEKTCLFHSVPFMQTELRNTSLASPTSH